MVHAQHGDRSNYRPLNSPLCPSSSIFDVIERFLGLFPFGTFYLADLNAITGDGDHQALIHQLADGYPDLEFWLDDGRQLSELNRQGPDNIKPVIGSESQRELDATPDKDFILSLDFQAERRLGNPQLFDNPVLWPKNIIIMTLAKVGSDAGPDFAKLSTYRQRHPDKNFIAAGGVRDIDDLYRLNAIGINQALIASSLHSGAIGGDQIRNLQAKKYPD